MFTADDYDLTPPFAAMPFTQQPAPSPPVITHREIHQAIIDIGDLQAQLDSLKITLYKSLNTLRQQEKPNV